MRFLWCRLRKGSVTGRKPWDKESPRGWAAFHCPKWWHGWVVSRGLVKWFWVIGWTIIPHQDRPVNCVMSPDWGQISMDGEEEVISRGLWLRAETIWQATVTMVSCCPWNAWNKWFTRASMAPDCPASVSLSLVIIVHAGLLSCQWSVHLKNKSLITRPAQWEIVKGQ